MGSRCSFLRFGYLGYQKFLFDIGFGDCASCNSKIQCQKNSWTPRFVTRMPKILFDIGYSEITLHTTPKSKSKILDTVLHSSETCFLFLGSSEIALRATPNSKTQNELWTQKRKPNSNFTQKNYAITNNIVMN